MLIRSLPSRAVPHGTIPSPCDGLGVPPLGSFSFGLLGMPVRARQSGPQASLYGTGHSLYRCRYHRSVLGCYRLRVRLLPPDPRGECHGRLVILPGQSRTGASPRPAKYRADAGQKPHRVGTALSSASGCDGWRRVRQRSGKERPGSLPRIGCLFQSRMPLKKRLASRSRGQRIEP
jgi:hypothetical protein